MPIRAIAVGFILLFQVEICSPEAIIDSAANNDSTTTSTVFTTETEEE